MRVRKMSHLIIELKKSWQMNQNAKTRIRRHFRLCLSLVSNGKGTNLHTDGSIKKKKGNVPQYNALPTELRGTCHEW